ncbi:hypothetical protein FIP36_16585 [Salmonella enterica]|nr:hypothetical protein [Salmonella enterica]
MEDTSKENNKHNLETYGWSLGNINLSSLSSSYFIYLRDLRVKNSNIFCVTQHEFDKVKVNATISINHVVSKIECILNKQNKNNAVTSEENNEIKLLLISYIKKTKSYALWRKQTVMDMRLHMLINIYQDVLAGGDKVMLRPVLINPDAIMLTPDEVSEYSSHVLNIDQQNNPDWFN